MACGVDAAVRALDEMPQVFGTLRACQADFGLRGVPSLLLTFTTYAPARTSAQTLGVMLQAIVRTLSDTHGVRQIREMIAASIVAASALREASAAAERHSLGPSADFLSRAASILGTLHWNKPAEVRGRIARQLDPMLTGSAAALIGPALMPQHEWWRRGQNFGTIRSEHGPEESVGANAA
jgi:hypothetical protein